MLPPVQHEYLECSGGELVPSEDRNHLYSELEEQSERAQYADEPGQLNVVQVVRHREFRASPLPWLGR
jgi:hypothetical protein